MMETIKIENFRSFKETPNIDLKPLTLLLGQNSSGKSSFLRLFPLFKQSFNNQAKGILSLFGDYVDFGNFKDVHNSNSKDDYIAFEFGLELPYVSRYHFRIDFDSESKIKTKLKIKIKENKNLRLLYISEFIITINNNTILCKISENNSISEYLVNNEDFTHKMENISASYSEGGIFFPSFTDKNKKERKYHYYKNFQYDFLISATEIIKKHVNPRLKGREETIIKAIEHLDWGTKESTIKTLASIRCLGNKWNKFVTSTEPEINIELNKIYNRIVLFQSFFYIDLLELYFSLLPQNITYCQPLRLNAERYHRRKPLNTNDVAPDGSNLVAFIESLSAAEKKEFKNWTIENFGFFVDINNTIAHQSIIISDPKDKIHRNIIDLGFGYSQILPIILKLWSLVNNLQNHKIKYRHIDFSNEIFYTIEQPELHLHPAFQAKLMKAFTEVVLIAKKSKINLHLIIETHSETMINYLGKLVAQKHIPCNQISILIFDKEDIERPTQITQSTFNEDGVLLNWPFGFFSALV